MTRLTRSLGRCLLLALMIDGGARRAWPIILYETGDPTANTTAPGGALSGSGWDMEGEWGSFLGTAVAPRYFLTAQHIGGVIGQLFVYRGASYTATAYFDDPDSDLRLWRVDRDLPAYTPLYSKSNEAGQTFVVLGRGTQRGDPVYVNGLLGPALKGWEWGASDGLMRWGENQVASIINGDQDIQGSSTPSGGKIGELLEATFDKSGVANEADLSSGDSGGAVFINDSGTWKLAGINFAVDGPFRLNQAGPDIDAALFDLGGVYTQNDTNWQAAPDLPLPQPSAFYATRVSAHLTWIQSILSQPIPAAAPVLLSASSVTGPYSPETDAQVDPTTQQIRIPQPSGNRFYQLSSSAPLTITQVTSVTGGLNLQYK